MGHIFKDKMIIPDSVKIGALIHKVLISSMVDEGNVITGPAEIIINGKLSEDKAELALLHEIFEVINNEHELKLPHNKIMTLSYELHQVLKDNRGIFNYNRGE